MKKFTLLILAVLIFFSCSTDEESSSEPETTSQIPPEENETGSGGEEGSEATTLSIDIEGLVMDFENLSVVSPLGSVNMDSNGSFEEIESTNELPVIVTNSDDELLFGYYPNLLESEEIIIDDIVLFFIANYPEVSLYAKPIKEIQEKLAIQDISHLNELIKESLRLNRSPIEDITFVKGLTTVVEPILENFEANRILEMNVKSNNQNSEDYFEIRFKRYGVFEIPNQAPMYASLGVGFYDINENKVEYKILKSKSIIFSAGSIAQHIYDDYLNPDPNLIRRNGVTELAWTDNHDGPMEVQISNGRHGIESMIALTNKTAEHNSKMVAALMMGYVIPEALFSEDASICYDTFKEKVQNQSIVLSAKILSAIGNGSLSSLLIFEQLESESKFLSDLILDTECYNTFMKTYLVLMIDYFLKIFEPLSNLETLSQIFLLNKDFYNSTIHEKKSLMYGSRLNFF